MPRRAPAPPEPFSRRLGAIVGATLASVTLSSTALGDEGRAYRIVYTAPLACPTAADFEASIRSSTERARPARGDEPAVELTIEMVAKADGFAGELTVRHPDGSAATRSIPAESCADAVAAVAFVAAMILDPNARPPAASTGEAVRGLHGRSSRIPQAHTPHGFVRSSVRRPENDRGRGASRRASLEKTKTAFARPLHEVSTKAASLTFSVGRRSEVTAS